jgi:hypothetical protein
MSCDEGDDAPTTDLPIEDAFDAFVEAWCERLVACECDEDFVQTQADCQYEVEARITALQQVGNDGGLMYDGACLGETLDRLDDRGCDPNVDQEVDGCQRPCNAYHGGRELGEPCEEIGNFSDCAQGLSCAIESCDDNGCTGTCRDPCRRADIGDSCDELQCVEGALCVYEEADSSCRRLPKLGDPCLQGSCADDLFCVVDPIDPTIQTCTAPAELGGACMGHVQCESGYCPAGFCQERPGKGEPCFSVCADGLQCDFEKGECEAAAPGVCSDHPL